MVLKNQIESLFKKKRIRISTIFVRVFRCIVEQLTGVRKQIFSVSRTFLSAQISDFSEFTSKSSYSAPSSCLMLQTQTPALTRTGGLRGVLINVNQTSAYTMIIRYVSSPVINAKTKLHNYLEKMFLHADFNRAFCEKCLNSVL